MPTDHSDTIAYIKIMLELLAEMEPSGKWQDEPLVAQYRNDPYSLTRGNVKKLKAFLDSYHRGLEMAAYNRKYEQLELLE